MEQVIRAWEEREITLLISPETLAELIAVLARPRIQQRTHTTSDQLLEGLKKYAKHVPGKLPFEPACRDPKDDKFLACAVEGNAHYLVSSDKDLLDMKVFQGVCILNPGQFLVVLQISRMDATKLNSFYSPETLRLIQQNLCLDSETRNKVDLALVEKR